MRPDSQIVTHLAPAPLYVQIKESIRARILDGTYKAHEQMPSESEMIKDYGVSRTTVRQALGDLQKEGLLFKVHGKGTFVSRPKAFQELARLQGFGEAMSSKGYETFSQLISVRELPVDSALAKKLLLDPNAMVSEFRRVRYLNREPISLDVTYLPLELGRRLIKEDLVSRDIFLILENDYDIPLGKADLQIEAVLADELLARLLKVAEGTPILRIERLTFTANGQPIDYEHLYYRGDAFQYRLSIERAHI
ncbi:GntR family transcriptional regulator [Thermithiobacillus plumbiphilus]|uniref:GntR family transcriptional regulator n=1 Tax=Thermithiobacillus plumbiphilus TaxID=1729899 RepID=A0ABU9DBK5_9PROT